jgi:hypothetical protein
MLKTAFVIDRRTIRSDMDSGIRLQPANPTGDRDISTGILGGRQQWR